jgi:hypothetical protein
MNSIAKLLIFFIVIFLALLSGVFGKDHNNIIKNKLYLFTGIMIFQFILNLLAEYKKNDYDMDLNNIIGDSIEVATASVIGYSIYIDLLLMDSTKTKMIPYIGSKSKNSFSISCIIMFFVSMLTIIKSLIKNN